MDEPALTPDPDATSDDSPLEGSDDEASEAGLLGPDTPIGLLNLSKLCYTTFVQATDMSCISL